MWKVKIKKFLFFVFIFSITNFPCMCSNINNNGNEDDKHVSNFSSTVIHDGLHKMVNKNYKNIG